ncbi:hypothetical protein GIS00_19500 [Nakamurella sp. YIM 132087]|uniref:Uncharacterized protein n=1 Tax=Nakamurella alba TaxID=2665158 RepID=A0A7K1FPQ3_9ACTN|nr:hypothetical protein [Nakamurella alba]MTD16128.1 hypothetical protein [Nakamurella alba]
MRADRRSGTVLIGLLLTGLAGCTPSGPADTGSAAVPAEVRTALEATIAAINATANGPVAGQRAVLDDRADPGQAALQSSCGAATSTLSFEPVWTDLQAADFAPTSGTLTGPVYSLPTLIRIHRGGRIVGTDVAELHLTAVDGVGRTTALCVG